MVLATRTFHLRAMVALHNAQACLPLRWEYRGWTHSGRRLSEWNWRNWGQIGRSHGTDFFLKALSSLCTLLWVGLANHVPCASWKYRCANKDLQDGCRWYVRVVRLACNARSNWHNWVNRYAWREPCEFDWKKWYALFWRPSFKTRILLCRARFWEKLQILDLDLKSINTWMSTFGFGVQIFHAYLNF